MMQLKSNENNGSPELWRDGTKKTTTIDCLFCINSNIFKHFPFRTPDPALIELKNSLSLIKQNGNRTQGWPDIL